MANILQIPAAFHCFWLLFLAQTIFLQHIKEFQAHPLGTVPSVKAQNNVGGRDDLIDDLITGPGNKNTQAHVLQ